MKETLYIILNKHMPHVFKCGITKYDGPHRAKTYVYDWCSWKNGSLQRNKDFKQSKKLKTF